MKVTLDTGAYAPIRAHETDAGLDIRTPHGFILLPQDTILIDTGVHMELPHGTAGFIKSKSGLATKRGIIADTGIIDEGYTGSIGVMLRNTSGEIQRFEEGDKIAQMVIVNVRYDDIEIVDKIPETERGAEGFGSTGR